MLVKLKVRCSQCQAEVLDRGSPDAIIGISAWISLTPTEHRRWTCPRGHVSWVWFAHPFHELLLYRGIQDLAGDDTRSAVISFYSAWDNFVLFMTEDFMDAPRGRLPGPLRRAEPATGVYAGVTYAAFREWPRLVSRKSQELRNEVVHGMKLPTVGEVTTLAEDVLGAVRAGVEPVIDGYQSWLDGADACRRLGEWVDRAPLEMGSDRSVIAFGLRRSFAQRDLSALIAGASTLEVGEQLFWSGDYKQRPGA